MGDLERLYTAESGINMVYLTWLGWPLSWLPPGMGEAKSGDAGPDKTPEVTSLALPARRAGCIGWVID